MNEMIRMMSNKQYTLVVNVITFFLFHCEQSLALKT